MSVETCKLRRELAQIEGELADKAREFVEDCKIYIDEADMEENQIRNLIQLSEDTRSLEAIKSFIRYQIGRSSEKKKWRFTSHDKLEYDNIGFGEALILEISRLWGDNSAMIQELSEETDIKKSEIFWNIVKLYLGYMSWFFISQKKNSDKI